MGGFEIAARMLLVMTVFLGLVYPVVMTGIAQVVFPEQANGSMVYMDGKMVGSKWIGQNFTDDKYFQGRPSSAGEDGYDAAASSGSNLGPTSAKLMERITVTAGEIRLINGMSAGQKVPSDLVTASGSGLDPHITPEGAVFQVKRVAAQRNLTEEQVLDVVTQHVEEPQAGFLGDRRVNVLLLNMALDKIAAQ